MLRRNLATIASLVLIYMLPVDVRHAAASAGSAWWTHLAYPFFHANLFHLAANAYSLCYIPCTWKKMAAAYLISVPASFVSLTPAVGFSSVLFALLGMNMSLRTAGVMKWAYFLIVNICFSFFPGVSWEIHLICFLSGFIYSHLERLANDYRRACSGR